MLTSRSTTSYALFPYRKASGNEKLRLQLNNENIVPPDLCKWKTLSLRKKKLEGPYISCSRPNLIYSMIFLSLGILGSLSGCLVTLCLIQM